ncbi:MAG: UbiX family flavin prenyltransferase [Spirochaetes bacterium]|nr:UbiX family flavin prenyltransferase [Spirochaetota bacterium]
MGEKVKKIIVAITGASGAVYGVRTLTALREAGVETHLVMSRWACETLKTETDLTVERVKKTAVRAYDEKDLSAPIASGSYASDGMVVVPCSMKTLASIASGYAENLISRAADIAIKEGRRLVLVPRETPLSPIHLENMLKLSRLGVVILPPMPAFYCKPEKIEDLVDGTVGRILDRLEIPNSLYRKWK